MGATFAMDPQNCAGTIRERERTGPEPHDRALHGQETSGRRRDHAAGAVRSATPHATTADTPAVVDVETLPAGDGAFYAFVVGESTPSMRELFAAMADVTAMAVPPVEYRPDGPPGGSAVRVGDQLQSGRHSPVTDGGARAIRRVSPRD
jgi:hypothetical protein